MKHKLDNNPHPTDPLYPSVLQLHPTSCNIVVLCLLCQQTQEGVGGWGGCIFCNQPKLTIEEQILPIFLIILLIWNKLFEMHSI